MDVAKLMHMGEMRRMMQKINVEGRRAGKQRK
jgi:hypothetical protein